VAAQAFDPKAADFSGTVKKLSEQVAQADFMFLAASAKLARRAWVQIRGKLGTETRVYATSHIYDGHFDPEDDKYLVGLNFVEIPWLVEPTPDDAVSSKGLSKQMPRLYAMESMPIALAHGWIGCPITRRHRSGGRPGSSAWIPNSGFSVS